MESKYANQKAFIRSLDCNTHVGLEEDKMGSALIPEDLPVDDKKTYKAVRTTGNSHCLYNAVSLTLVGDESYATLLRLLVALELVINVNFYAQHPKFTYFPSGGRHSNTIFSLCLSTSSNSVFHDTEQNVRVAMLSGARVASKPVTRGEPVEWSGYFHVAALSAVLASPVFSTYPNCPSWSRDFVHGIIYPRMAQFSGEPVFLLWSQQGSDNRPGAWYVPNHFVPLYSVEAGGCNDSATDCKDEPNPKFVNVNLHLGADAPIKCIEDERDLHKKTAVVPEEGKKKMRQSSDKGITYLKGTERGCLEQFGFFKEIELIKEDQERRSVLQ